MNMMEDVLVLVIDEYGKELGLEAISVSSNDRGYVISTPISTCNYDKNSVQFLTSYEDVNIKHKDVYVNGEKLEELVKMYHFYKWYKIFKEDGQVIFAKDEEIMIADYINITQFEKYVEFPELWNECLDIVGKIKIYKKYCHWFNKISQNTFFTNNS